MLSAAAHRFHAQARRAVGARVHGALTLTAAMRFGRSKRHVIARLAELRALFPGPQQVAAANASSQAAAADNVLRRLQRADRSNEAPLSRLLVLAAGVPLPKAAAPTGVVDASPVAVSQVLWLAALSGGGFEPHSGAVGWAGKAADRSAVIAAGRTLAGVIAARRNSTFRAAACLPSAPSRLLLFEAKSASPLAAATCRVSSPDFLSVQHELVACDPEAAAADAYPYGA
jgi:hypothetical protein